MFACITPLRASELPVSAYHKAGAEIVVYASKPLSTPPNGRCLVHYWSSSGPASSFHLHVSAFIPDKYYSMLIRLVFSSIETDELFDVKLQPWGWAPTAYPFIVSGFMPKGVRYRCGVVS